MVAQELLEKTKRKEFSDVLKNVYGESLSEIELNTNRIIQLVEHYISKFPGDVDVIVVRAPGRVNLIGEHTDYNGFPVMPMAISRDMLIVAGAAKSNTINFTNSDPGFEDNSFQIEKSIPPYASGYWGNYVKSATQGLIDFWGTENGICGVNMAISGNVPLASGLSSSAAFTVAAALAILAVNNRQIEPIEFAEIMAKSDHYVGMASGGMDQAASILGEKGKCLKIDFMPLKVQPVKLPENISVVVTHSKVKAAKAGNAKDAYNRRTVECRIATAVLHKLGCSEKKPEPKLLCEWFEQCTEGFADALKQIGSYLHENGYSVKELSEILNCSEAEIRETLCVTKAGSKYDEPEDGFQLLKRAKHVISEAERVEKSLAILEEMPDDAAEKFGKLMNASHESCRYDYEISCRELDALVAAGRDAGSFGSRLTGAGFGGCTVHLVPSETVDEFMEIINKKYYKPEGLENEPDNQFVFSPVAGACVLL